MDFRLEGQVAIVTGGTRGIGRAIARALAGAGAKVVLTGRDAAAAQQAAEELAAELPAGCGGSLEGVAADVGKPEDCTALVEGAAQRHGRLDILVNNAGITRDKLLARMAPEDWQAIIDTNLTSVFHTCRAAGRLMARARAGRIINISSVVGVMGNAGQANYAAAKAGMIGFSKSLARELGGRGVTVNCIAPGFIETAMTDVLGEQIKTALLQQIPLGRLGSGDDVAAAALYLASPAAAYVTGSVLHVDGGMAM